MNVSQYPDKARKDSDEPNSLVHYSALQGRREHAEFTSFSSADGSPVILSANSDGRDEVCQAWREGGQQGYRDLSRE